MFKSLFCSNDKKWISLGLHKWGKWKDTATELKAGEDGTKIVGRVHVQERVCEECGFIERHVQRISNHAGIST